MPNINLTHHQNHTIVQLRVRPQLIETTSNLLDLPAQASGYNNSSDITSLWIGPGQWWLTSASTSADKILLHIDTALTDQIYAATDMSSAIDSFTLTGAASRAILAMGCGLDMHETAFKVGHSTRTSFAGVALYIAAVKRDEFSLYIDRSLSHFLKNWIAESGRDPIIQDSKLYPNYRELT